MTVAHVAALHFDGRRDAAIKRLQKLKAAGYLNERPRRPNEPAVHCLTAPAFRLLAEGGHLAGYPSLGAAALDKRARVSDRTLRHELEVMDVKAAITSAVRGRPELRLVEFSTWPAIYEFRAFGIEGKPLTTQPDGFIRVHEAGADGFSEACFFLEVDRSTERQGWLATHAACYLDYYRRGGFAVRNGGTPEQFGQFPFRVLMVLQNAERRNNAAEALLRQRPPIRRQVWLTTLAEATADPLGPVWMRPGDYLRATARTPFDPHSERSGPYRRRTEREALVERAVPKNRPLEDPPD